MTPRDRRPCLALTLLLLLSSSLPAPAAAQPLPCVDNRPSPKLCANQVTVAFYIGPLNPFVVAPGQPCPFDCAQKYLYGIQTAFVNQASGCQYFDDPVHYASASSATAFACDVRARTYSLRAVSSSCTCGGKSAVDHTISADRCLSWGKLPAAVTSPVCAIVSDYGGCLWLNHTTNKAPEEPPLPGFASLNCTLTPGGLSAAATLAVPTVLLALSLLVGAVSFVVL